MQALLDNPTVDRVYAACRSPERSERLQELRDEDPRLTLLRLDVTDKESIESATAGMDAGGRLDLVINTAGLLHSDTGMKPEKRVSDINADDLLLAYDVNALGAMRLAVALEPFLKRGRNARFVSLSARVGSISDNRLGGWYAYRASKAALNMLLRTLAIEWGRLPRPVICAALHPGTVDTALSAPFTRASYKGTVFSPAEAAEHLLEVINDLDIDQSGGFFAWDGEAIPW